MFKIHTEVASGAQSRGYQYDDPQKAFDNFRRIAGQLEDMNFVGDLIMVEDDHEVTREVFTAAR